MTGFDDRERASEAKFAHDEETKFKISIKRNKMLALWAAGKIGLNPEESHKYIGEIIEADFTTPGYEDVVKKIYEDLKKAGAGIPARDVLKKLEEFEAEISKEFEKKN